MPKTLDTQHSCSPPNAGERVGVRGTSLHRAFLLLLEKLQVLAVSFFGQVFFGNEP
jgi:hypothetical protein